RGARLDLPRSDTPFELPQWPETLPEIAPPLALQADTIEVDDFAVTRDGAALVDIRRARGGIDATDGRLHAEQLVGASDRGRVRAKADALDPGLLAGSGESSPPLALDLRASGVSGDMQLEGRYERDGFVATVQPSQVTLDDQVLTLDPLVVDVLDGRITARGS